MSNEIISALEIGSNSIVLAVGEPTPDNRIKLLYANYKDCKKGLKSGVVTNISLVKNTVSELVEHAEEELGDLRIKDLYVGVKGSYVSSLNSNGVHSITRSDKEIVSEDVYAVIENAKAVHISSEREILHTIPQGFSLDKEKGFDNPVGMEGNLLEVDVHIVTAVSSHLNNIIKAVTSSGFGIIEPVYHLYPLSEIVLTDEEKKIGCVLIDIGENVTSISVYYDGKIRFSKDLSIGSYYITQDIAIGLHIPFDVANNLKEKYGCALSSLVENEDEEIEIPSMDKLSKKKIIISSLLEIIKPRLEEILLEIRGVIEDSGFMPYVNGAVIVGGGSLLKGMPEAVAKVLQVSDVRYGFVSEDYVVIDDKKYSHQKYTTAISLLCYPVFIKPQLEEFMLDESNSGSFKQIFDWIKSVFS